MANSVQLFNSDGDLVGTYGTIQAAVDAASDGWTVAASTGTYNEHVILDKAVTLNGEYAGLDGNGVRGAETNITGGVEVRADGVTVDGVEIGGSFDTSITPSIQFNGRVGMVIEGANATIENSVFTSDGSLSRAFVATTSSDAPGAFPTGLDFNHNLVQNWTFVSSLVLGSDGSITDNAFSGNLSGSITLGEISAFDVSGNSFSGAPGDVSGFTAEATLDVGDFLHDNTYSNTAAQPIKVELGGPDGQVVTGTDTGTQFNVSYHVGAAEINGGTGSDTISDVNATGPITIDLGAGTAVSSNGTTTFTSIANALGSALANDSITGDDGANVLDGSNGDDTIAGKGGNDTLLGDNGNDSLDGGDGNDSLDGGFGNDTASYADAGSAVTVSLAITGQQDTGGAGTDTLTNIENLTGSDFGDTLTGDAGNNTLDGGAGDDTLSGGAGDDTLDGGTGTDTAHYTGSVTLTSAGGGWSVAGGVGEGTDTLSNVEIVDDAADGVIRLAGNGGYATIQAAFDAAAAGDTIQIASGDYTGSPATTAVEGLNVSAPSDATGIAITLGGTVHGITLLGDSDIAVTGNELNNVIAGNDGNNSLSGLGGDDTLQGGNGDDTLDGGTGSDTASYADAAGAVTVNLLEQGVGQVTGGAGTDTLFNIENLTGSAFNDTLIGDANANVLSGLAGDDTLQSGAGNDTLNGGDGDDTLQGGDGNDTLDGGDGTDTASYEDAGSGVTVSLAITTAQDTIGAGTDTLAHIENLTGSNFNDTLTGDAGDNVIDGGVGIDTLIGGAGNDTLDGGAGSADTASYADAASAVTVSLAITIAQDTGGAGIDTLSNIEALVGSNFDDTLTGDAGGNDLSGLDGNDTLQGGDGIDVLDGGDGTDTASYADAASAVTVSLALQGFLQDTGGAGQDVLTNLENLTGSAFNDALTGDAGANVLSGLDGDDTLQGGAGNDTLDGGDGTDTASYADAGSGVTVSLAIATAQDTGGAGSDTLSQIENLAGSAFADTLTGDENNNAISGLAGNDTLQGGDGDDTLDGGDGTDTASYADAASGVTVSLALQGSAQDTAGAGSDTLTNIENLAGSAFDDSLTGDAGNNSLSGLDGDDTLQGGDGDDSLDGGAGSDTASYADAVHGVTVSLAITGPQDTDGAGTDTLTHIENLSGSAFGDTLTGDAGNNTLSGEAGVDYLTGGAGDDTLDGGANIDKALYTGIVTVTATDTGWSVDGGVAEGTDTLINIEVVDDAAAGQIRLVGNGGYATIQAAFDAATTGDTIQIAPGDYSASPATTNVEGLSVSAPDDATGIAITLGGTVQGITLLGESDIDVTGNAQANVIDGNSGNNSLSGLDGNDTLQGGDGDDTLDGGNGSDTASYADAAGAVTVSLLDQGGGQDTVGAGTDTLLNIENLAGSAFNDVLTGDADNNVLSGLAGDDTLQGGAGNDTLDGGTGSDTATYEDAADGVSVNLAITTAQNTIGAGTDTLVSIENLTGSALDDMLTGNSGANVIMGLDGDDTVQGGAGNDTLDGGDGADTASYADAASAVTVSLAVATAQDTVGAGTDTLANFENLTGSAFADTLTGDDGNNVISGLAGDDTLQGGDGDDTLDGGSGSNTASYADAAEAVTVSLAEQDSPQDTGGAGSDTLFSISNLTGSAFNDTLTGDANANILSGLAGDDTLQGGAGNDTLDGGTGTDTASYEDAAGGVAVNLAIGAAQNTVGAGSDTLTSIENLIGSSFDDTLTGNDGANSLSGGDGDDTLNGGAGNDMLDGGDNTELGDTASYADAGSGVTVSLAIAIAQDTVGAGTDTLANIENLIGSGFGDTLTGDENNNRISGLAGNDTLQGGVGDDVLDGGSGSDTASYADAEDAVTVSLAITDPQDTGNAGNDTLISIENLTGSAFNDTLTGDAGNNVLSGLAGDDILNGGAGNDTLDGGTGSDTATYEDAAVGVTVSLAITTAQDTIGAGSDTLIGIENLTGSALADTLTGDAGANVIMGLDGNDTIEGGAGNDNLDGGDNTDAGDTVSYAGAASAVTVSLALQGDDPQNTLGAGSDILNNFENLSGSAFGDTLTGDDNNNVISGLAGDDTLQGGNGDDTLDGGAGTDTASYADAEDAVTVTLVGQGESQDTGSAGTDTLIGIENLAGSGFDDTLTGNAGANVLSGLAGDDILDGGAGNDTLDGGTGSDTASYEDAASAVTVTLATPGVAQDTHGAGTDILSNIENLTGSAFDDVLTGNAAANTIMGLDGNDTIEGGADNDTLDGGDNGDIQDNPLAGDTVSYAHAASAVTVSLALQGDDPQNTLGAGSDILNNFENLAGSAFGDTLTGDDNNNVISGLAGNDTLQGGNGDDTLDGGTGTDTASYAAAESGVTVSLMLQGTAQDTGGAGSDTLVGIENLTGSGHDDTLGGDAGNNVLDGGGSDDPDDGGIGDTVSYADAAAAVTVSLALQGSAQNTIGAGMDTLSNFENLTGSAFGDTLTGDAGANSIMGLEGDDTINGGGGNDMLDGGDGTDTVSYATVGVAVTVSLALQDDVQNTIGAGTDTLTGFENLTGTAFGDTLSGDDNNNVISGLAGNDTLSGGNGDDTLDGSTGTDTASYAAADSGVTVSLAITTTQDTGGAGSDTLIGIENLTGSAFDDTLGGDAGNNVLDGGGRDAPEDGGIGNTVSYADATAAVTVSLALQDAAQNTVGAGSDTLSNFANLTGSNFNDSLTGDTHDNIVMGLDGNDTLNGGLGDDTLDGGDGTDTASYADAASAVTVDLNLQDGPQDTGGAGNDTLTSIENVTGSNFDDILIGDFNDNKLSGGLGNDMLTGGDGADNLDGGAGTDTANYTDASDGVVVSLALSGPQDTIGAGIDTLANIENLIGSAFNDDTLTGNAGNNVLQGLDGADTLNGGAGNDTLDGGDGDSDTASYLGAAAGVTVSLAIAGAQNTIGAGTDTLIGIENLTGSALNDTLTGNAEINILDGGAGNDVLNGGANDDNLLGGAGNDTLMGGAGDDIMDGGAAGSDTASYADATGAVTVDLTQSEQDTIGAGFDTLTNFENLTGSNFNDTLIGNAAANILNGGAGNDLLNAGAGNDSLIGGAGNDTLLGGAGNDSLDGGVGVDTASYADATAGVAVSLAITTAQNTIGSGTDTLVNIENLTGSNLNDTLTGNTTVNILNGGAGNDTLSGGAGNDSLIGAAGNDTLIGGAGNDSLDGGAAGSDTASYVDATAAVTVSLAIAAAQNTGGGGIDTLANIENLTGSNFNDTLTGSTAANILNGGAGNDTMNGGAGNDSLIGAAGNDILNGGAGNDSMDGGAGGTDTASYQVGATAGVTVSLAIAAAQNTIGAGVDTLINFENLTGTAFNDTLTGNSVANVLNGLDGNDTLNGGAGNDTLNGAVGNDTINGGAGNDHMDGGAAGLDTASYVDATAAVTVNLALATAQNTGGSGTDTLLNFENLTGSNFNDKLSGSAVANTLSGLGGNDTLNGAAGNDTLSGGAGNDRLIGGVGNDSLDGGVGVDSFVFDKGFGKDTITGFVATGAAHDSIDFSTATFANFAAVHSHMAQSGANVIITLDSADTITIKNVTVASLTAADFTFHPGAAPAAPPQAAAAAWATHGAEANSHFHLG